MSEAPLCVVGGYIYITFYISIILLAYQIVVSTASTRNVHIIFEFSN